MFVHNIFVDLLISLSSYINKNFLKGTEIKEFHYNIGNASFEYDFNYEPLIGAYPFGYLSILDFDSVNVHPYSFFRDINTNNYNSIEILLNHSKNISLKLQESLYSIKIDFLVQCDSQLSAVNFKNLMISHLPIGKPLQFLRFMTFLELDEKYINKFLFDPENDEIDNLFLIHNDVTGNFHYNMGYELYPLIKLDSASINISSQIQYFYDLNFSFEILITYPIRLQHNFSRLLINDINSENRKYKNILYKNIFLFCNNLNHTIKINKNIYYSFSKESHISDNILIYDTPEYYIEFEEKQVFFSFESTTHNYNGNGYIINDSKILLYYGPNNKGIIENFYYDKNNNIISGRVFEEKNNYEITINIKIKEEIYKLKKIKSKNSNIKITEYNYYPFNKTIHQINNINKYAALITDQSIIKEIKLVDGTIYNDLNLTLDKSLSFNYNDIVIGMINSRTGALIKSNNVEIDYILFDLNLEFLPFFNSDIENININLSMSATSVLDYNNIKLLSNQNLHKYNLIISDKKILDESNFTITLTLNNIVSLDINNLIYNFIFTNFNFTISEKDQNVILDKINSNNSKLIFSINNDYFYKYFSMISIANPVFFTFGV